MKKPILFMTVAFPGSGKTHISERIAKDFSFFHLNSDWMRAHMIENPTFTKEEHKRVFGLMNALAQEMLQKNISVIFDANMNKYIHRKGLYAIAKKAKASVAILRISTSVELAEKRIEKRGTYKSATKKKKYMYKKITLETLHGLRNEIEEPRRSEKVIELDGSKPYSLNKKILMKVIGV